MIGINTTNSRFQPDRGWCFHSWLRLSILAITSAIIAQNAHGQNAGRNLSRPLQSSCQDDAEIIKIGKRLYSFGTISTKQVDSGDMGMDEDGREHLDREVLLVPVSRRPVNSEAQNVDSPTVSPSGTYLTLGWKVIHGVNGMALDKLSQKERTGHLRYRLVTGKLALRIAHGIQKDGEEQRLDVGWLVGVRGWRGIGDRYMIFDEYGLHEPEQIAHGTYDVLTDKVRIDLDPKFGPNDPRLPGEKFPQTRWRLMTPDQINKMGLSQVRYAINEIYARYGKVYDDDVHNTIQRQFQQFDWFRPGSGYRKLSFVESGFSKIERANLKSLKTRRNELLDKPADWKADWEQDD